MIVDITDFYDDVSGKGLPPISEDKNDTDPVDISENEEVETEESEEIEEVSTDENNTDAYSYFEVAKSLGVISVPDDFNFDESDPEKSFQEAVEYTNNQLFETAKESILSSIKDPTLQKILEVGINSGSLLDVKKLLEVETTTFEYENIDLSKEVDAERVYRDYLKATTKFSDSKIDKLIDMSKDDDELEEVATAAKEYFLEQYKSEKKSLIEETEKTKKEIEAANKQYIQEFNTKLNSRSYDKSVRSKIAENLSIEDNSNFKYQNVFLDIQKNPDHFIDFLEFLSMYDKESGFSLDKMEKKVESKATSNFLSKIQSAVEKTNAKKVSKNKVPETGNNHWDKNIRKI